MIAIKENLAASSRTLSTDTVSYTRKNFALKESIRFEAKII